MAAPPGRAGSAYLLAIKKMRRDENGCDHGADAPLVAVEEGALLVQHRKVRELAFGELAAVGLAGERGHELRGAAFGQRPRRAGGLRGDVGSLRCNVCRRRELFEVTARDRKLVGLVVEAVRGRLGREVVGNADIDVEKAADRPFVFTERNAPRALCRLSDATFRGRFGVTRRWIAGRRIAGGGGSPVEGGVAGGGCPTLAPGPGRVCSVRSPIWPVHETKPRSAIDSTRQRCGPISTLGI